MDASGSLDASNQRSEDALASEPPCNWAEHVSDVFPIAHQAIVCQLLLKARGRSGHFLRTEFAIIDKLTLKPVTRGATLLKGDAIAALGRVDK